MYHNTHCNIINLHYYHYSNYSTILYIVFFKENIENNFYHINIILKYYKALNEIKSAIHQFNNIYKKKHQIEVFNNSNNNNMR